MMNEKFDLAIVKTGLHFEMVPEKQLLFFKDLKRLVFSCVIEEFICVKIVDSNNHSVVQDFSVCSKTCSVSLLEWNEKELLVFSGGEGVLSWYDVNSGNLMGKIFTGLEVLLQIIKINDESLLGGTDKKSILLLSFDRSKSSFLGTTEINKDLESPKFQHTESSFVLSKYYPGVFYVSHCLEKDGLNYDYAVSSVVIKKKSVLSFFFITGGSLFDSHKGLKVYLNRRKNVEYIISSVCTFKKLMICVYNTINCQKVKNIFLDRSISSGNRLRLNIVDDFLFLCSGNKMMVHSLENEEMKKKGEKNFLTPSSIVHSSSIGNEYTFHFLDSHSTQNIFERLYRKRINVLKVSGLPQDNYLEKMDLEERLSYLFSEENDILNGVDDLYVIRLVNIEIKVFFKSFLFF